MMAYKHVDSAIDFNAYASDMMTAQKIVSKIKAELET
jgi:hypothetical protein